MKNDKRILLAEDEEHLLEAIKLNLEMEGYVVSPAKTGKQALKVFREERFNLIILDVMLPELDGFQVCQTIRLSDDRVPIFFLTAKNGSSEKVKGLKIGGDDYLTKPFNLEEFILRIHKLMARSQGENSKSSHSGIYNFRGNVINFTSFEVKNFKGKNILLTKKESGLLKLLTDRRNEVVSRESILETVWGYDIYPSTRTIDNFILAFRKYFEPDPGKPVHFISVRGVGYKFVA